jgi:outer membrane protein assembly factor BamB
MKRIVIFFAAVLTLTSISAQEKAQWRGENRDGIYNETGLLKTWPEGGPKLLWHFDELGEGHASAAVTSNAIYTAGTLNGNGFVVALDNNGKLLWKTEYGKEWVESWNGVRSTPMICNNKVYIMSGYAKVVCMDAKTGKIEWSVDMQQEYGALNIMWGVTDNLLSDNDKLFCTPGGTDANVVALDVNTGKLIWKCKGKGEKSAYGSPALIKIAGKSILVTTTEKSILGIDASNGNLLWSHPQTNQWAVHPNTPVYKDGYLYSVTGYGKGGVMLKLSDDGTSITEVWKNSQLDPKTGGVVLLNNYIYGAGDNNKKLFCVDWKTGEIKYSINDFAPCNIISADGLLYCYAESGKVGLIEPKADGFNIISSFKVPFGEKQHWAHLVIHNKRLFVRHGSSLMVYNIAN